MDSREKVPVVAEFSHSWGLNQTPHFLSVLPRAGPAPSQNETEMEQADGFLGPDPRDASSVLSY